MPVLCSARGLLRRPRSNLLSTPGQIEISGVKGGSGMAETDRPRAPTIREVASAAQLDISTVSRALRPETRSMVKPETLKRVLAAADALGYRANPFARGL